MYSTASCEIRVVNCEVSAFPKVNTTILNKYLGNNLIKKAQYLAFATKFIFKGIFGFGNDEGKINLESNTFKNNFVT